MSTLEYIEFIVGTDLEHLDESDTEIEVREVAADQAQTEEETDWDDSAEVDPTGHLDGFPAIKEGGVARKDLGHDGRKGQMVGGEDDGVAYLALVVMFDRSRVEAMRLNLTELQCV